MASYLTESRLARIAIVGAGFSGTMVAVHLIRRFTESGIGAHIYLIERKARVAKGLAYETKNPLHLLNVPAQDMSALPDQKDHFYDWVCERFSAVPGGSFLPRGLYGEYLCDLFSASLKSASATVQVEQITDSAESFDESTSTLFLESGRTLVVDKLVLATGNFTPKSFPVVQKNCDEGEPVGVCSTLQSTYINDPWSFDLNQLGENEEIVLLGTGLTTVDMLLELHSLGHKGRVTAISRHGLLSQTHRLMTRLNCQLASPPPLPQHLPNSVNELFRQIKAACRSAVLSNAGDWRPVINQLRPHTQQIWKNFSDKDKSRFLRHLKSIWETYRHRMAPEVALVVDKMRKEGSLRIVAARVVAIQTHANSVHVEIRRRGQAHIEVLPAKRAFNCTGPNLDFRQPEPSFIASLIANGSAVADKSGLGISTLDCGVVVNKLGEPSSTIVTIGSLRRGALWETTAVPELRGQAVELAQTIVNSVTIDNYCPAQQALQL